MARTEEILPVKLFLAILMNETIDQTIVLDILRDNFGSIDYLGSQYQFDLTDYYENEMGKQIQRFFVSFENLIQPNEIAAIKRMTNSIETCFAEESQRPLNLDPGYLDYQKVVLASLKFGGQKIYLQDHVYADLTLYYKKGSFTSFPWTFPDFKDDRYYGDLLKIRELYKNEMKKI